MATYTGRPAIVNQPIADLYSKFNDLSVFEEKLRQLPPDQLAKIGDITFTKNSISIQTPAVGALTFEVTERVEPTKIVFGSPASPIPLAMVVNFKEITPESTEVSTVIDVEIPAMLKAFVGPKLQEAADKFGEMMTNLSK